MIITHREQVASYKPHVCFVQKSITNLISSKNTNKQYCFTCDRLYETLIIHQEEYGKQNMSFIMNGSGLHYYDPEDEDFLFVKSVSDNKKIYNKKQIKAAEQEMELYTYLG